METWGDLFRLVFSLYCCMVSMVRALWKLGKMSRLFLETLGILSVLVVYTAS